jgi:hypothetical protein
MEIPGEHGHVQRKRASGGMLAVGAIAGVDQQRERRDLVADRGARTTASQGKDRSRDAHHEPRTKRGSKTIWKIVALRRLRFQKTRIGPLFRYSSAGGRK